MWLPAIARAELMAGKFLLRRFGLCSMLCILLGFFKVTFKGCLLESEFCHAVISLQCIKKP